VKIGADTVVAITGAAHGIGFAICAELARRGAIVAMIDINAAGLATSSSKIARSSAHACDVSDAQSVDRAVSAIVARHGQVNALINCAGISVSGRVDSLPIEYFERAMAVNFWGIVHTCRAFLPQLRAAGTVRAKSAICNVLSEFALVSVPTKAAYAASKHAARAFSESLSGELEGSEVFVTTIYPGATATRFIERGYAMDSGKAERESAFLMRSMTPEFVARKIVHSVVRQRARVLVGRDARIVDLAVRLSPGAVQRAIRRFWRKVPFL
jgi:short-subunit dehydrogenase